MSDFTELVEQYIAIWNEPDATRRRAAVAAVFADDGSYTDPLAQVRGHDGISAVIEQARAMFPGHVFQLVDGVGGVDAHHDVARFGWELVSAGGGESLVIGFDVAVRAADGRIAAVHGFLDKVPTA